MEQLNRTLRNPAKIRFESKQLGVFWEAGSKAFDSAIKKSDLDKAVKVLDKISNQKSSGRTFNKNLKLLAQSKDLKIIFYDV